MKKSLFLVGLVLFFAFSVQAQIRRPHPDQARRRANMRELERRSNESRLGNNTQEIAYSPQKEISFYIKELSKASDLLLDFVACPSDDKESKRAKQVDKYAEKILKTSNKLRKKFVSGELPPLEPFLLDPAEDSNVQARRLIINIDDLIDKVNESETSFIWTTEQTAFQQTMKTLEEIERRAIALRSIMKN